jgi:hypothetical protein
VDLKLQVVVLPVAVVQSGSIPEGSAAAAGPYMADVKHIVVDPLRLPATDGGN